MSSVFHRSCHGQLPTVSHGEGVYLFDTHGKAYLDGCGGAAVSNLGHNHPRVKRAIRDQLDAVPYAHTGFFTTQSSELLAKRLVELAPEPLKQVYFVSGGSEAVEAALKMARQYFVERGKPQKTEFIARRQSYHGNTLGALAVGGTNGVVSRFVLCLQPVIISRLVMHIASRWHLSLRRITAHGWPTNWSIKSWHSARTM